MKKILTGHTAISYSRKATGKEIRKNTGVVIYYDPQGRCRQIVRPETDVRANNRFDGNWLALVQHITKGEYYKFELI